MLRTFGSPPGRTTCCEKNNRKTVRVRWRQTCPSSMQRWCPLKMLVRILLVWGGNGHCSVWGEVLGGQQRPSPQVGFLARCRGAQAGREPPKRLMVLDTCLVALCMSALLLAPMLGDIEKIRAGDSWCWIITDIIGGKEKTNKKTNPPPLPPQQNLTFFQSYKATSHYFVVL